MDRIVYGAATGDVLGWFDGSLNVITDIQGRTRKAYSFAEAIVIMRDLWSWNV